MNKLDFQTPTDIAEFMCGMNDHKTNKAKEGCPLWKHHSVQVKICNFKGYCGLHKDKASELCYPCKHYF